MGKMMDGVKTDKTTEPSKVGTHGTRNDQASNTRQTRGKKKYLGDPKDPHFVPSSPIISRQSLSFEVEEELTRSCTLALSEVTHTDDDEEQDPLMKYVTGHLAPVQVKVHPQKHQPVVTKPSIHAASDAGSRIQTGRSKIEDVVSSSEVSKRDTIDRTNTSTPLTMLSEMRRRPSNARQNSTLRSDSKLAKPQAVYAFLDKSQVDDRAWKSSVATRSTTALGNPRSKSREPSARPMATQAGNAAFNRSLPSLPRFEDPPPAQKHTSGISRVFQSLKRKKPGATAVHVTVTELSPIQRAQTVPITDPSKRHRFNLGSIFHRRPKQQPLLTA